MQEYANSRGGTSQTGLSGWCFHRALFIGELGLQSSGESQETRGQAASRSRCAISTYQRSSAGSKASWRSGPLGGHEKERNAGKQEECGPHIRTEGKTA